MSSRDERLNRLYSNLSVTQRLVLLLRSLREKKRPHPDLWSTLRGRDRREWNRGVDRIVAATRFGSEFRILLEKIATLEERLNVFITRRESEADIHALGAYIRLMVKEPITESEYRRIIDERRNELVPVQELAEILAYDYPEFSDTRYVQRGEGWGPGNEVLHRAYAEAEALICGLFRAGVFTGAETPSGIRVRAGTFYDWLGESIPLLPEFGCEYETLPDSEAAHVEATRTNMRFVEDLLRISRGSTSLPLNLDDPLSEVGRNDETIVERYHLIRLRESLQEDWYCLRCYELALVQIADEQFAGEDPLVLGCRETLSQVRSRLLALRDDMRPYAGEVSLPEPDVVHVKQTHDLIARKSRS